MHLICVVKRRIYTDILYRMINVFFGYINIIDANYLLIIKYFFFSGSEMSHNDWIGTVAKKHSIVRSVSISQHCHRSPSRCLVCETFY